MTGDHLRRQAVEGSGTNGGQAVIREGLSGGEAVVVGEAEGLGEGAAVEVR